MLKDYYALAKPGLVYGNLITAIAGFLLGARMHIDFGTLAAMILGIAFVMGSGCVFNNVIDQDIDGTMSRTKGRAIVAGRISKRNALIYGAILGATGLATLALRTNILAAAIAGVGWFAYVVLYSLWTKRRTSWGTVVGSIAGAVPPVVGYCAASGRLDLAAALLFAILVLWQMPHFYAIATYRRDDYAAAGVPVLPVSRGVAATKVAMFAYIAVFLIVAPLLAVFGYAGPAYFVIALLLGLAWLAWCIQGFRHSGAPAGTTTQEAADKRWARQMFFLSLVVMVVLFLTIAIGAVD